MVGTAVEVVIGRLLCDNVLGRWLPEFSTLACGRTRPHIRPEARSAVGGGAPRGGGHLFHPYRIVAEDRPLSIPVNFGLMPPSAPGGAIAGSVLPIRRAEELIATLPSVLSVRIVASPTGAVDEVHVLTTDAVLPKQTVRNIESALMAQLGMRVNHRKISIATTLDPARAVDGGGGAGPLAAPAVEPVVDTPVVPLVAVAGMGAGAVSGGREGGVVTGDRDRASVPGAERAELVTAGREANDEEGRVERPQAEGAWVAQRRRLLFEDVEVRRSRSRGAVCQVTISRDGAEYTGESEGPDTDQSRLELTARAALAAVTAASAGLVRAERVPVLQGVRQIDAFDRTFMFVVLQARGGRTPVVLTGTSEVRESPESGVVVAVLDATNRWLYPES